MKSMDREPKQTAAQEVTAVRIRRVAKDIHMQDAFQRLWSWTAVMDWMGEYGRRKKKDCQGFLLELADGLCYDSQWEENHSHISLDKLITVLSTHSLPWLCQKQRGKINVTCVRRRGWHLGDPLLTLTVFYEIDPQRAGQSFCRGLRESISGITFLVDKNKTKMSCCQSFAWDKGHSIERPLFHVLEWFWPRLYLKH